MSIAKAARNLPKPIEPEAEQAEQLRDRDIVKQTLYLPPGVHEQLREAAFSQRKSMQQIAREAFNLWFEKHGFALWDEAKKRKV
jgi:hypothetical protein